MLIIMIMMMLPDVPQAGAPGPHKLEQRWRHDLWTHEAHPPDRDGRILQQRLRGVLP